MNKLKKILALVSALFLIFPSVMAAPFENISSGVLDSPRENVFRVMGTDTEFILLDSSENHESKFFIMAKSYFPKRAYGKNQRFDPEDPGNIAYFLNNEFLTEGCKDSFTNRVYKLPDEVIAHIDKNHIWETEAGRAAGNCPERYSVKAGVALLSQEEYLKYQAKIGMTDEFDNLVDAPKYTGWWTRTGAATAEMICIRPVTGTAKTYGWTSNDAGLNLRPAFWVDKDFFKDVKIDLTTVGENVKQEIKKYYSIDELKVLYPESLIYDYLGFTPEVFIGNAEFLEDDISGKLNIKADFTNNLTEEISGNVVLVKYTSGGFPRQMVSIPLTILSKEKKEASLEFNLKNPLEKGEYIKLFYSEVSDRKGNTSNSIIINNFRKEEG